MIEMRFLEDLIPQFNSIDQSPVMGKKQLRE